MAQKNLHLLMTADAKDLEQKVGRIEERLKGLASSTAGLRAGMGAIVGGADPFTTLKGMGENLIGSIPKVGPVLQAGMQAAEGFVDKIRETQRGITEQARAARAAGADVTGFSALLYASGADAETMGRSLFKLSEHIAEAQLKGGEASEAFGRLGLSAQTLSGMSSDQAFYRVVGALEKIENRALRAKIAHDLLGKSAEASMRLVERGTGHIDRMTQKGLQSGAIITDGDAAAAQAANAAVKEMSRAWDGMWNKVAVAFAPVVTAIAQDISKWSGGIGDAKGGLREAAEITLLWYYMAKDAVQFFVKALKLQGAIMSGGDVSKAASEFQDAIVGPSAENRVKEFFAKFDAQVAKSAADAKREQQELDNEAKKQKTKNDADAARQKEEARLDQSAKKVIEGSASEWDKFSARMAEINELAMTGRLSWDQYSAALGRVVDDFEKLNDEKDKYKQNEAMEFGGAAEFSARQKFAQQGESAGTSAQDRLESVMQKVRKHTEDSAKSNREMAEAMKRMGLIK